MAGLMPARVVGQVTAQQVVGLITGMGVCEEWGNSHFSFISLSLSNPTIIR